MKKTKQFFSLSIGRAGVGLLLMALVMMAMSPQMMWADGTKPTSGSGTIDAPYIITSEANLIWFRDAVNGTNTDTGTGTNICAKLNADITLTSAWADTPIGTSTKKYKGTFNGNKKTIKGLSGSHGLFAYTTGTVDKSNTSSTENIAIIKDLTLEGSISASTDNIGSFVEHAEGSTRLYRVESKVGITITGAKTHIGGIMGGYYHTEGEQLRLNGCTYSGAMNVGSSTDSNGGIIGFCEKDANVQINHCFFAGSITSSGSNPTIGGILGYARDDTGGTQNFSYLQNCFCSGSIKGSDTSNMGIFVGYPNGSNVVDNITNNTYVANSNSSTGINMLGHSQTAASSNKAITISVKAGSNGTVSTSYVNPTADANTLLQVKATPADHYHSSWSDGGEQTHTKELTSDINVTATFAIDQHTVTLKKYGDYDYRCKLYVNGTESTGGTYDYGTELTLKAVPDADCYFSSWRNGNTTVSSTAEFKYTVTGDATLTAVCYKTEYTLTLKANNDAWGTVSGPDNGKCDGYAEVAITATPNEGYHFVNWTKDGTVVSTSASCKYLAHGNETLVANFALNQYTITVTSPNQYGGTVTGSGTYDYNTTQTITATPSGSYHFVAWEDGNTEASRQITVTGDATYKAKFAVHVFTSQTTDEAYLESAATCTKAATYYYKCTGCEEKETKSYISTEEKDKALGHDWSDDSHTYCNRCKHSWINYTAKEGTAKMVKPYKSASLADYANATHTYNSTTREGVIEFTSKLTSIGEWAFSGCENLQSITVPDGVTSIGNDAFYGCSNLESITIPGSVTSIGEWAFNYCTSLQSITIPGSVTSISYQAFSYCSSLQSITIPSSVTSISYQAFSHCSSLQSITIPSSVTSIGYMAFSGCSSLQSITIPSSVTSIGQMAFYGCTLLGTVAFNAIPQVGNNVFDSCTNLNTKTLALTDESYVAADKGSFPALTKAPTFTRTLTTEWETIVVPFAVTITDNDNYEFYTISGVEGSNLQTTKATGTLAAGTPVLVRKKVAGDYALRLYGVAEEERKYAVSTTINNPAAVSGLTLTGTYAKAEVATGNGYVFNGSQFVKTTKATQVAPFHAYLDGAIDGVDAIKLPGVIIPGDLNDDGLFTISDLTLLVELLNSNGTITNPAADVDRDGDVDIDDVNALRNKLLGK